MLLHTYWGIKGLHIMRIKFLTIPRDTIALILLLVFSVPDAAYACKAEDEVKNAIVQIESGLRMPEGSYPLLNYNRFYANGVGKDSRYVIGVFRYSPVGSGTVQIVKYESLPIIFDGGCNIIRVRYSKISRRVEQIECNGEA